jgi:hypothetical protein
MNASQALTMPGARKLSPQDETLFAFTGTVKFLVPVLLSHCEAPFFSNCHNGQRGFTNMHVCEMPRAGVVDAAGC